MESDDEDNIIKIDLSLCRGEYIYDSKILRYVGVNTYTTLMDIYPDMFKYFPDCDLYRKKYKLTEHRDLPPNQLKHDILMTNLNKYELKTQIILLMQGEENVHEVIKSLKNSSSPPGKYLTQENYSPYISIILITIFILIVLYIIYILGGMNLIFQDYCNNNRCTSLLTSIIT